MLGNTGAELLGAMGVPVGRGGSPPAPCGEGGAATWPERVCTTRPGWPSPAPAPWLSTGFAGGCTWVRIAGWESSRTSSEPRRCLHRRSRPLRQNGTVVGGSPGSVPGRCRGSRCITSRMPPMRPWMRSGTSRLGQPLKQNLMNSKNSSVDMLPEPSSSTALKAILKFLSEHSCLLTSNALRKNLRISRGPSSPVMGSRSS
mmetsp:Transcript_78586/g.230566  ORF Transcript_78586/g.230566 Transcript_78586/m.230566 type:complete len:201 (+) Transcript_78586:252-854(+)